MSDSYSFPAFKQHFDGLAVTFEKRRLRYKTYLLLCTAVAIGLVALLPWYARDAMECINQAVGAMFRMGGGDWGKEHVNFGEVLAFSLMVVVFAIWLIVWPIFMYRGRNKGAGLVPLRYSLKDHIYSQLIRHFGAFQFAADGGNFIADIKNATIVPPYQAYFSEDYIRGVLNDCTVKVADTKIVQIKDRKRIAVFSGLVIVVDISDIKVKLTGTFNGRTVLIADTQKELRDIVKKYTEMTRVTLPNADYEHQFEAFTSNMKEANALLAPALLDALLSLHAKVMGLKKQTEHWDSRIAHAVHAWIEYESPRRRKMLDAEKEYERNFGQGIDLTKADIISLDKMAINSHVQAEFFDDKLIITVPCAHDLFEPNSLFEPALNTEDAQLLFAVMQTLQEVTGIIKQYLPRRNG